MAEGKTDKNGYFQIEGYTDEFTTIDPKLNIYHDCNDNLVSSIPSMKDAWLGCGCNVSLPNLFKGYC